MRLDIDELQRLCSTRLLNLVRDAQSDLLIADYSARAQYDDAWDAHPILLDCRGTIIRPDGQIVAKPFRKFFNAGERPQTSMERLALLGKPEIAHKLDGSMGTLFRSAPHEPWRIATRGHFASAQALYATEVWQSRHATARPDPDLTYIFEIIYPENRVVVDYGARDELVLIGVVVTESGRELPYATVVQEAQRLDVPCVTLENDLDLALLHSLERPNFEGFVLFWPDDPQQMRVKVKLADYVRLHRLIMGLNERTAWELLRDGADLPAIRRRVPEEVRAWLDDVVYHLAAHYTALQATVKDCVSAVHERGLDPAERTQRKEIAQLGKSLCPPKLLPAFFLAVDHKDTSGTLWKLLEPPADGTAPRDHEIG